MIPALANTCWNCGDLHCREVQRRSVDLKTAGCGEWKEDQTGEIVLNMRDFANGILRNAYPPKDLS